MQFVLMPATFLNGNRWMDKFDVLENRTPLSEHWKLKYFQELDEKTIKRVISMVDEWEKKQKRDITEGVFKNIVDFITNS